MWLDAGPAPVALAVAAVRYSDGHAERYAMLLARVPDPAGHPVVATLEDGGPPYVIEAAGAADAARALLRPFAAFAPEGTRVGGALHYADLPPAGFPEAAGEALDVRPLGAEQSNTSLRAGPGSVFKLFRRLEPGENPEVEMGRFLTSRTGFRAAPALRGSILYEPGGGTLATLGVLQEFVASHGDGWRWTLERLREEPGGPAPGVLDAMRRLGETTADMHLALASGAGAPGFEPEPATAPDFGGWKHAHLERAGRVLELLEARVHTLPEAAAAPARRVLAARARLAEVPLPSAADPGAGFQKIRVHGDFHLGQTLRVERGFVLIDFEGEPARPLAERRALSCALRDVAGMLRSFDYAAAEALGGDPGRARPMREAYLEAYLRRAAGGRFLPADPGALGAMLAFQERDKVLYEIDYELNNRPDWVRIPLAGLADALEGRAR